MRKQIEGFTKYEEARILGARALQIAMDAPLLMNIEEEKLEEAKYDPLKIAEIEFRNDVLPITIKRPLPEKVEGKLKREETTDEEEERKKVKKEEQEEKDIEESGEIMELAKSDEELDREEKASGSEQDM